MRDGTFRADLYYRLNVVSISLPPLRQRVEDIPLLVKTFLLKHADLSAVPVEAVDTEVLAQLACWPFRGNVRELENWIERAIVLAESATLTRDDFPTQLFEQTTPPAKDSDDLPEQGLEQQVAHLEKTLITAALTQNQGNKSAAARQLGLSERAIRYKMKKYAL